MKINGVVIKLPKKIKDKWVTALRSGKYKQGVGHLYKPDIKNKKKGTYCCLGVLGDVCGISSRALTGEGDYCKEGNLKAYKAAIKSKLPKIILNQDAGEDSSKNIVAKLATLNDDKKWSFKKIATYIEKNL